MSTLSINMSSSTKSLLIVEDDRLILSTLSIGLKNAGFKVSTAESVDEAELWLKKNDIPDLVILDVRMPDRDGLDLAKVLNEMNYIPFMLLTAYSEDETMKKAIYLGAIGYIVKPVDINQLIPSIKTAITRAEELRKLRVSEKNLQSALDADRAISVAVGIIMDQHRISHNDSLDLLRNKARSQHMKLIELASNIINSRETLNL